MLKAIVLEAALVATAGLVFALGANALSPRGIRLSVNYFPDAGGGPPAAPFRSGVAAAPATAGAATPSKAIAERLGRRGLQVLSQRDVVDLFRSEQYQQGLVLFIDARDEPHYTQGHIPGAWQFNHYRAEEYLPAILPLCLNALQVVVYCSGGECEDSEFAAIMLRDAGVPRERIFVYPGGMTDWASGGLPVESGPRGNGRLLQPTP